MRPPQDLRTFLSQLEQAKQLARVAVEVDPYLELAAIVDRTVKSKDRGPGLLFEKVRGAESPVAANLFGTDTRLSLALGVAKLSDLTGRLAADLAATAKARPTQALGELLECADQAGPSGQSAYWLHTSSEGVTLDHLPAIVAWPGDGGAYLTLPQVYTRDPETGALNCGMYRVQKHEAMKATIRFRQGSDGMRHLSAWHARGKALPVAVALGGPPVLTWAASLPLPSGICEIAFSRYLAGSAVEMSSCQTSDLLAPTRAEIVIEGEIPPGAWRRDGPFGNHTGWYDIEEHAPEMQVNKVYVRTDAVFPWTLVGPPPQENVAMARAAFTVLLPLVQMAVPSVRQLYMPDEGIFHGVAFITLDAEDERQLTVVAEQLWETHLLKGARLLVLGGEDQDAHDPSSVFWRVLNRTNWKQDLLIAGERLAVDARRMRGPVVRCAPQVATQVERRWTEYSITGWKGEEG